MYGSYPLSWSDFGPNDDYFDDVLGLALLGVIPLPSQNKYVNQQGRGERGEGRGERGEGRGERGEGRGERGERGEGRGEREMKLVSFLNIYVGTFIQTSKWKHQTSTTG